MCAVLLTTEQLPQRMYCTVESSQLYCMNEYSVEWQTEGPGLCFMHNTVVSNFTITTFKLHARLSMAAWHAIDDTVVPTQRCVQTCAGR